MKEVTDTVSIKDRIKAIRAALKMSQREFGKPIYISQSLLTEIEVGRRKINNRTIQLIVAHYKVNKEWMMTGKGEMFSEPPPDTRKEKLLVVFNELDEMLQDYLLLQSKELLKIQKQKMILPS
jgi:transcriptional regulator with XRE-family HTH domain